MAEVPAGGISKPFHSEDHLVLQNYTKQEDNELDLEQGQTVEVVQKTVTGIYIHLTNGLRRKCLAVKFVLTP